MLPLLLDVGWLGSVTDVATFVAVVVGVHRMQQRLDYAAAGVVALARAADGVRGDLLARDLDVDDSDVRAVRADGGFPAESDPDGDAHAPHHFYVGVGLAVFGFASIWPYYPATGAATVLLGTLLLVDDVVSHVFGVPTPVDWVWRRLVAPNLPANGGPL